MQKQFIKAARFADIYSFAFAQNILTSRWTHELLATGGIWKSRRRQFAIRYNQLSRNTTDMNFRLIIVTFLLGSQLNGQVNSLPLICDNIVKIDSSEFRNKKVVSKSFPRTTSINKVNGIIRIPTKDSSVVFREVFDQNDNGFTYNVIGEDKLRGWVLIERVDLHENIYFIVSPKSNKIDTLIGVPQIYGDKIVCLESMYTDDPWRVEIWQIEANDLKMIKKFSLAACNMHGIESVFLSNKTIYVSNYARQYWRAKILD